MKPNRDNISRHDRQAGDRTSDKLIGYPAYPASEDIYNNYELEKDIDPENISGMKQANGNNDDVSGSDIISDVEDSGRNLDVPGSELDDKQEDIGNEDEENNYYSLGGDVNTALEEDQGV